MEKIPALLLERLTSIFSKEEMTDLKNTISLEKRQTTFRVNTLKATKIEVENALHDHAITFTEVPYFSGSYILDANFTEKDLWNLDIYKDGKIYIQGLSSQFPVHFFDTTDKPGVKILDACAAPGGKTSQLAEKYPESEIYAFEPNKIRYDKMCHNLAKLGCENVIAIHDSIENISSYIDNTEYFDMILVDAPCSSEGSLSLHNHKFLDSWDISHIKKNYKRQKRICDSVLPYLKEEGEFTYSTCTLAPEENEAVIHFLLCHDFKLELNKIDFLGNNHIKTKKALKTFEKYHFKKEISELCLRVIPSEYSEGFFIAKMQKCQKI